MLRKMIDLLYDIINLRKRNHKNKMKEEGEDMAKQIPVLRKKYLRIFKNVSLNKKK